MNQTFLWGVDVIDVNLKFFVRDLLQHLFPGQLLPLLHFLFTLFLKVQSEPKKMRKPPVDPLYDCLLLWQINDESPYPVKNVPSSFSYIWKVEPHYLQIHYMSIDLYWGEKTGQLCNVLQT